MLYLLDRHLEEIRPIVIGVESIVVSGIYRCTWSTVASALGLLMQGTCFRVLVIQVWPRT